MQVREMRFARIDGTEVLVEVKSAAEAKAAIKELRHKKKELALLKRRIAAEEVRARRAAARDEAAAKREARQRGLLAALKRISRAFGRKKSLPDVDRLRRDVEKTEEILHNIESCIIQLEGRLLD